MTDNILPYYTHPPAARHRVALGYRQDSRQIGGLFQAVALLNGDHLSAREFTFLVNAVTDSLCMRERFPPFDYRILPYDDRFRLPISQLAYIEDFDSGLFIRHENWTPANIRFYGAAVAIGHKDADTLHTVAVLEDTYLDAGRYKRWIQSVITLTDFLFRQKCRPHKIEAAHLINRLLQFDCTGMANPLQEYEEWLKSE